MKYLLAVIRPKEDFDETTLKKEPTETEGVYRISGMLKDSEEMALCAVKFDMAAFDQAKAEEWLAANDLEAIDFQEIEVEMQEEEEPEEEENPKPDDEEMKDDDNYSLENVEIMREGVWNNTTFTGEDLDEMVRAFDATKKELKPYLKLGHDKDQKLLQSDGLPAAGWITELKKKGKSIYAKIENIPKKVYDLIKKGRYGRFSAEVFFNQVFSGKLYKRALKALALLGSDTPAVSTMDDLVNLYKKNEKEMTFEKVVSVELENYSEVEKMEIENLKKENAALKERLTNVENNSKMAQVQAFIEGNVKEGKILPSQVEFFTTLLMSSEVHNFSYMEKDELKTAELSNFQLVEKIMENAPKLLDLTERSQNHKPEKKNVNEDDELHDKIEAYAKENKVSYTEAYDIVTAEAK
jgi:phage I-like protein